MKNSDFKEFLGFPRKCPSFQECPCISDSCWAIRVDGDVAEWSKALPC